MGHFRERQRQGEREDVGSREARVLGGGETRPIVFGVAAPKDPLSCDDKVGGGGVSPVACGFPGPSEPLFCALGRERYTQDLTLTLTPKSEEDERQDGMGRPKRRWHIIEVSAPEGPPSCDDKVVGVTGHSRLNSWVHPSPCSVPLDERETHTREERERLQGQCHRGFSPRRSPLLR
jgi:hypothetical protein